MKTPAKTPVTSPKTLSMSNPESVERIKKLTNDFDQALLLSKDTASEWTHGRPMFLLHCDDELNLYFGAALESSPVDEIIRHPQVAVSMQDGRQMVFINGFAAVESGQKLVERGWGKRLRPMLKDSESFEENWCLIHIRPHELSVWDYNLGTSLRYLAAQLKSKVLSEPTPDPSQFFEAHLSADEKAVAK